MRFLEVMSNKPLISIITVCFNSESTIEDTIKSVLSQDYDDLEYIIIDGGSLDGTLQIIDKYTDKISVVVSEPDKGISDAFNKGIKLATGDVIGIINSDDILSKDALKAVGNSFITGNDVYRGDMIIEDVEAGNRYLSQPSMKFSMTSRVNNVCHPSTFIAKQAYQKWGLYRVDFKYMMDLDLLYRFYMAGAKFKYIPATLAVFRIGGRTADNWRNKLEEHKQMLKVNNFPIWLQLYKNGSFVIYQLVKQCLYRIVGINKLRNMKYGSR